MIRSCWVGRRIRMIGMIPGWNLGVPCRGHVAGPEIGRKYP